MKKIIGLMILASVFILSGCNTKEKIECLETEVVVNDVCETAFTNIDNDELRAFFSVYPDYQYMDVRTMQEYDTWHIREFDIQIDYYQIENNMNLLSTLDKDTPVVIMCNSGNRSVEMAKILFEEGFTTIYNLEDGIQGWDGPTE